MKWLKATEVFLNPAWGTAKRWMIYTKWTRDLIRFVGTRASRI